MAAHLCFAPEFVSGCKGKLEMLSDTLPWKRGEKASTSCPGAGCCLNRTKPGRQSLSRVRSLAGPALRSQGWKQQEDRDSTGGWQSPRARSCWGPACETLALPVLTCAGGCSLPGSYSCGSSSKEPHGNLHLKLGVVQYIYDLLNLSIFHRVLGRMCPVDWH